MYVCSVISVDHQEGTLQVQGLRKCNYQNTHFSVKENDISCATFNMVLAILPEPVLIESNKKFIYEFFERIDVQ